MRIRHLIPLLDNDASENLHRAQEATLASVWNAIMFCPSHKVDVTLVGDFSSTPNYSFGGGRFLVSENSRPSSRLSVPDGPALPQLGGVLSHVNPEDPHELIIYSQPDIGLQPYFYDVVARFFREQSRSGSIPRRTLPVSLLKEKTLDYAYAEIGEPHPGHDCFFFGKDAVAGLEVGELYVGSPATDRVLTLNLRLSDSGFKIYREKALTFHFGDEREWSKHKARLALNADNWKEAGRVAKLLEARYGRRNVEALLEKTGLGRLRQDSEASAPRSFGKLQDRITNWMMNWVQRSLRK